MHSRQRATGQAVGAPQSSHQGGASRISEPRQDAQSTPSVAPARPRDAPQPAQQGGKRMSRNHAIHVRAEPVPCLCQLCDKSVTAAARRRTTRGSPGYRDLESREPGRPTSFLCGPSCAGCRSGGRPLAGMTCGRSPCMSSVCIAARRSSCAAAFPALNGHVSPTTRMGLEPIGVLSGTGTHSRAPACGLSLRSRLAAVAV